MRAQSLYRSCRKCKAKVVNVSTILREDTIEMQRGPGAIRIPGPPDP